MNCPLRRVSPAAALIVWVAVTATFGCTRSAPPVSAPNSPSSPSSPVPDAGACPPSTCEELGRFCGTATDGCGGTLDCGKCVNGESCSAEGRCVGASCVKRTCADQGASCGQIEDGCGGMISCGACPEGQSCGGAGTPNECGSGTCTPRTCAQLGKHCGVVGDGCGGLVDCGGCAAGESCSASNVCEANAADGGTVAWLDTRTFSGDTALRAITSDGSGSVFVVESDLANASTLSRYSESGAQLWSTANSDALSSLVANPVADALVASGSRRPSDCQSDNCALAVIDRFTKSGAGPTAAEVSTQPAIVIDVAADGSKVLSLIGGMFEVRKQDGTSFSFAPGSGFTPKTVRFNPQGGVLVGGTLEGTFAYGGQSFTGQHQAFLMKLSATGQLLWGKTLPTATSVFDAQGTASGSVVVLGGFTGTLQFAGQSFDSAGVDRGFFGVLEADGRERFARGPMGFDSSAETFPKLAVDPVGRAFIAYKHTCDELVVLKYNLAGALEWRTPMQASLCGTTAPPIAGIALSGHAPVVAGTIRGTANFAGHVLDTGADQRGYLLQFNP